MSRSHLLHRSEDNCFLDVVLGKTIYVSWKFECKHKQPLTLPQFASKWTLSSPQRMLFMLADLFSIQMTDTAHADDTHTHSNLWKLVTDWHWTENIYMNIMWSFGANHVITNACNNLSWNVRIFQLVGCSMEALECHIRPNAIRCVCDYLFSSIYEQNAHVFGCLYVRRSGGSVSS